MKEKNAALEKSGGRRFTLYEEVGQYFNPDGTFNRKEYVSVFKDHVKDIKKLASDSGDFEVMFNLWVSEYLGEITSYLKEKGILNGAVEMIKTTVESSVKIGIENIMVPSAILKEIMQNSEEPVVEEKKKVDDKKQVIFQAALNVFGEDGFYKATMEKIAAVSGIGKGSVYRYFKSKEELLEQLLNEEYSKIASNIGNIFADNDDVLKGIEDMIRYWITYISGNPLIFRLIQIDQSINPKLQSKTTYYRFMSDNLPMFKERVVALNRENKLKHTSFYTVFYGIMGFMEGVVQKWLGCDMDYPLTDEIPIILETVFNGFVGEKASKKKYFIAPEKNKRD